MSKKATTLGVTYLVTHDLGTGRWNVTRGVSPTGAFARDKHTAIGTAIHEASREARDTNLKVEVWSVDGKHRTKEWPEK